MAHFTHLLVRAEGDGAPLPLYTSATLELTYTNPDVDTASAADEFGYSLGLSGSRVIVGARSEDAGAVTDTGKAYQFNKSTTQTFTFDNPSDASPDYFGAAVAIDNSLIVIGAPGDDDPETDSGKIYLYDVKGGFTSAPGTPTTPIKTFINPIPGGFGERVNDQFGYSVAISGDYIIAGAPYEDDSNVTDAGRAYVFKVSTQTLLQTLTQPTPGNNEYFGTSVDVSGDYVVIGAPGTATSSGAVYVYDARSGGLPLLSLSNPDTDDVSAADNFGNSVAISDKYVIVGAHNEDNAGNLSTGAAYIYELGSATPLDPILILTNPDTLSGALDYFGYSVSVSGNYAVVGAYGQDTNTGIAYVYKIKENASPDIPVITITNPSANPNDFFGDKVLISDNNILIGAKGANKVFQYTLS